MKRWASVKFHCSVLDKNVLCICVEKFATLSNTYAKLQFIVITSCRSTMS